MKQYLILVILFFVSLNAYPQSPCPVRTLATDLNNNPAWRTQLEGLSDLEQAYVIKGHKLFRDRSKLRLDIESCKKLGILSTDGDFLQKLPGHESTLYEIAKVLKNRCSSVTDCPTPIIMKKMVDYLDDLEYFVKNFSGKDGYEDVINAIQINSFIMQDGTCHLLAKIKTLNSAEVKGFEGNILNALNDADGEDIIIDWGNLCVNCRFDIELENGKLIELKSYRSSTLAGIHTKQQFKNQLIAYFEAGNFEYWFNGLKDINENGIKTAFQNIYTTDFYSEVEGSLFLIDNGITSEAIFLQRASDFESTLYSFIHKL